MDRAWSHLPGITWAKLQVSAISSITHKAQASAFTFKPLIGGTSILASWIVILLVIRPRAGILRDVFARTFKQMWGALL
jgi:lactate permease